MLVLVVVLVRELFGLVCEDCENIGFFCGFLNCVVVILLVIVLDMVLFVVLVKVFNVLL